MRKDYDFSAAQRGAVIPSGGKTRITIMLDDDVLAHFRAQAEADGSGYQTLINAALKAAVNPVASRSKSEKPITASVLRKILREELAA